MSTLFPDLPDLVLDDGESRDRIQNSLDESLLVEAAAGTGKTTALVGRIVAVVQKGRTRMQSIVAVTFTRKAAGELKLRLRQKLDEARHDCEDPLEQGRLEDAMAHLEEARIGTIHSFCAEILRERPVEARVDPDFEGLSEIEAPRLYGRTFRQWIQEKLNELPEGLRRALTRLSLWDSSWGTTPLDRLRSAGWQLIEWRDFPSPWLDVPFDRAAEMEQVIEPVLSLADLSAQCPYARDYLRQALAPARSFATWIRRSAEIGGRSDDTLEAMLGKLRRDLKRKDWKGRGFFAEGVSRQQVLEARDDVQARLGAFLEKADANLAALLREELQELVARYEDAKRRAGKLDFVDLLIRVRDLLKEDQVVRAYFRERFSHIFVDEFQDTDPLQAEILFLLSADDDGDDWREVRPAEGKLFLVGDPKQSIYRFRRADVLLYRAIRDRLQNKGVAVLHLSKSFRSVKLIQDLVNSAFAPEMNGDAESGQPDYVPLQAVRGSPTDHPSLIALPVPGPYGKFRIARTAIESCLPDTIAAFVEWLVRESHWTVEDPDGKEVVPIAPRHICLLFRRFMSWGNDVTRDYTASLEARGLSHLLVGARSFHRREEVGTVRAALKAVEWPDDELSVYATLKGTLFAISDNLLLRFKLTHGRFHPFRPIPLDRDPVFEPIGEALAVLKKLHKRRNRRPVVDTVNALLEATRAHAGFALRPAGNQVLANVQRICDLARIFEMEGGLSFRGFVEQLEQEADSAGPSEGPLLEEGVDGVRLMTVHAAKGLEFPIVILADMTAHLARNIPDKHIDLERGLCAMRILGCTPQELLDNQDLERVRDEAEGVRIAYVAATRARDILVVPAVGDEEVDGWLSPFNKAIYPEKKDWRHSVPSKGCPSFGDSSVLLRPEGQSAGADTSVRPGLHRPRSGHQEVVWWDPAQLNLGVVANFGLRQEELLTKDSQEAVAEESLRSYEEWRERRKQALLAGQIKQFEVITASEVDFPPKTRFPIQLQKVEGSRSRRGGKRFGTLVHAVLRDVDLEASESDVLRLVSLQARLIGASESESRNAVKSVIATLGHSLLERARRSLDCSREFPVSVKAEDGRILEGAIDLMFEESDGWTVVDYKTDSDLEGLRDQYDSQLSWYVEAVTRLTNRPVTGILLGI